jgi:hypothetical protein
VEGQDKEGALSRRLEEVLESITDRGLSARLREVFFSAARAIDRLSNLNLVKHEPTSVEPGTADLSLWEEMAPVVRDTVVEVNGLLTVISGHFGSVVAGVDAPASSDARLEIEVSSVLDRTAAHLTRDIGSVGEKLRKPAVVSDRWNLLIELQEIRAGLRAQIGDLVYLCAAACTNVQRREVVPGFNREVARAVNMRSTVADVRRAIEQKLLRLADVSGPGPVKLAVSIEGDLEAFAGMPAYRTVRAQTKRELVELRQSLREAAVNPAVTADELRQLAEPALMLFDSLVAQTRPLLTSQDRATWAACGAKLEQAKLHLALGSLGAPRVLDEAVKAAEALYGRDPSLDAFLRKARTNPPAELPDLELKEVLEGFLAMLGGLPFH